MNAEMILNLVVASFLSAILYVILKYFQVFKINNLQGLTFNYMTASSFAFFSNFEKNIDCFNHCESFLIYGLGIGLLFISVFYTAALTAQHAGITATSIAGKMSMVIPIIFGLWYFGDQLTPIRTLGIFTALAAVLLSTIKKKKMAEEEHHGKLILLLPLLLFIGSGLVDTSIKLSEHYIIKPDNQDLFLTYLFGSAGILGGIGSLYNRFYKKNKFEWKNILAGIILGITNYYSLVFLIQFLASPGLESSIGFAMTNVLVVIFSTLMGIFLFKEKLSPMNQAGIALAISSIIILGY
ncbi:MAG: EamA/RhaT family transporter [Bacteroidetes bacterium]|nr:EamA/RhaT family transporter [Bacteroidota bacterium]